MGTPKIIRGGQVYEFTFTKALECLEEDMNKDIESICSRCKSGDKDTNREQTDVCYWATKELVKLDMCGHCRINKPDRAERRI